MGTEKKTERENKTKNECSAILGGEVNARGEWNTVVDGYQSVEHECCFVRRV